MSDEMGDKFKQIAEMLGQNSNTNIPDNVKGLLNMLMSNSSTKEEGPEDDTTQKPSTNGESSRVETDEVNDISRKMKKAVNMLNAPNDPKVNLLNAIKPYLNKNRQRKLQTCLKLIKMGSLTKLFDDSE
jgi:hypothetical protein